MKRRHALKNLSLTIGGVLSLPAWSYGWSKESLPGQNLNLNPSQESLLAEIVETIIPATETPGAKELGVHQFVQVMIFDCFEKGDHIKFTDGLEKVNARSRLTAKKEFVAINPLQRTEVLNAIEKDLKASPEGEYQFYNLLKELTIQGYLNSQYVMTNILKYEMIPGRFNGSFPIKNKVSIK